MVAITGLLSGFAVKDIDAAREFYGTKLGLKLGDEQMGNLSLVLPQGGVIIVYPRPTTNPRPTRC